jgi:hypothetical protein
MPAVLSTPAAPSASSPEEFSAPPYESHHEGETLKRDLCLRNKAYIPIGMLEAQRHCTLFYPLIAAFSYPIVWYRVLHSRNVVQGIAETVWTRVKSEGLG